MSRTATHPHAAFDRFPALVETIRQEFGTEGLMATVERFVQAEQADLLWDGRIAERTLGTDDCHGDDSDEGFERVAVLSCFRGRWYYTAIAVVDGARRIRWIAASRCFDRLRDAERAFRKGRG